MTMTLREFNIIWIESCAYPSKTGIPRHKHEFFHYIYVVSGEAEILINEKKYPMLPGNIYMMPPFVEHDFYNNGQNLLRTLEIKFSLEEASVSNLMKELPSCIDVRKYPIKHILSTIYKETAKKLSLSQDIINHEFQLLLLHLLRCHEKNNDYYTQANGDAFGYSVERVIDYINENLALDITLMQLANIANFEKNYFVRKFKEKTGKTPMIYVRDKRISKAKKLLKYSDMNVTQVACATGFKNVHYFSKTFLDCTGQRPLDYRRENSITKIFE